MADNKAFTNADIWNGIRSKFPNFASHTSKVTKEFFTERGFEALKATDPRALDEWYELSLKLYLQFVNKSDARDPLIDKGFGEAYSVPLGAVIQRMSIDTVKPISPAYRGLKDGDAPNPFVVRKAKAAERFFKQNFDYASLVTVPDDYVMKEIFISDTGMNDYIAGIMQALDNGYTIQKYENKLEAINAGLNSVTYPLKDTQKYEVSWSATPSAVQLKDFVLTTKNIVSAMTRIGAQSNAFNAMGFAGVQDEGRLKMLVRPGLANALAVDVLASTYHDERLALPIDFIEVENFGGLQPYKEAAYTTPLYPVYDELGAVIGYNEAADQSAVTVETEDVFWKDPNEDILAIIADKGWMFEGVQNPYTVEPIRNPRGRYTNFWASSPGNTIAIDPLYNVVTISKAA